jgi:tRNA threonylcarbamoyladenosine biosynthesis protein TsaB
MSYILNIDTSENRASICLAEENGYTFVLFNESRNDHAAWLHPAIQSLLKENKIILSQLSAIAVSIGPGSYTGLRVSLSAAKGLCYASGIPLITVNTLEMAAIAVLPEAKQLICPMIDARRMEVFTGVYDTQLNELKAPYALILEANSFSALLNDNNVLFCGSGSKKLQELLFNTNLTVSEKRPDASHLAQLAFRKFHNRNFADTAYTEPLYVKEFYSTERKK